MNVPDQLFYTKDHEWVEFHQDKIIIGITDYAQSQLGDIIFVEMPLAGDIFTAGNTFGEIEAVKTVSELSRSVAVLDGEKALGETTPSIYYRNSRI